MYEKVSWLVYLDASLDSIAVHHALFDMELQDVCVLTQTGEVSAELITNLTCDPRIFSNVLGSRVEYASGFRRAEIEYFNLEDDELTSLVNRETDWHVLVLNRSRGLDYSGLRGEVRNAVVVDMHVMHGALNDSEDVEMLKEITCESFRYIPRKVWKEVQTTNLHAKIRSDYVMRELWRTSAEFLLTSNLVKELPSEYQVPGCKRRRDKLREIIDKLPQAKIEETPEDVKVGHAYARCHEQYFDSVWHLVSTWHAMRRWFGEGDALSSFWAKMARAQELDPALCFPLGCLPGVMGLELLIMLADFPDFDDLDLFRDPRPFFVRYLERIDQGCVSEKVRERPKVRKGARRLPVAPTSRRPATFQTCSC